MAPSPSRGSSRGPSSSSTSSRGGAPRGGGSTNTVATVVAVGLVAVIIGAVVFMSGGKKDKGPAPLPKATTAPVVAPPTVPGKPPPPAFPEMPSSKRTEASALVQSFQGDSAKADALYEESQKAKKAGDDAAWQSKLKQAIGLASGINSKWNEFIATLPSSKDYDEEEVARHYFEKESGAVARMTAKILRASKTDEK